MPEVELLTFLQRIWGDTLGTVRLATRDKDLKFRTTLFKWPEHESRVLDFIRRSDAAENEVYYSPDIFKPESMAKRSAGKDMVLGSRVICLDFDGNAPDPSVWEETGTYESTPQPSIIVQSSTSGNLHMYWILDEFVTDLNVLEDMRKTVTYRLKADASGWDAGQLLRPPYTTNYGYIHPDRDKKYDVFLEEMSDRAYSRDAFPVPVDFRPLVGAAIDTGSLPPVVQVLAENSFTPGFVASFQRTIEDIPTGKRSDALMEIAYFGAESGLSDTEIYALVQDADTRWGKYVHRTDRHKRLTDIVERARSKYPVGTGSPEVGFNFDEASGPELAPQAIYTWDELIDNEVKIEWFFKDLLSTTGYGLFAGTPGVGKTQLMIRMGVSVALNRPFLSQWENVLGYRARVLMFSFEMNHVSIKKFMTDMTDLEPYKNEIGENFFIYPQNKEMQLDNKQSQKVFEAYVNAVKPQLVIVDSLSKAVGRSLVDDEAVRRVNTFFGYIRERYQTALVVVHHSKKIQDRKDRPFMGDLDILYGSRFIGSEADFVLTFTHKALNVLRGHTSKLRFSKMLDPFLLRRTPTLDFVDEGEDLEHTLSAESMFNGAFYHANQDETKSQALDNGPKPDTGNDPPNESTVQF